MGKERAELTATEILELAVSMTALADEDSDEAEKAGKSDSAHYWDGWSDGLSTLIQHIKTGVKASCFPMGSCECHPFKPA